MVKPCVRPARRKRGVENYEEEEEIDDDEEYVDEEKDEEEDESDEENLFRNKRSTGDDLPLIDIFMNPERREEIKRCFIHNFCLVVCFIE